MSFSPFGGAGVVASRTHELLRSLPGIYSRVHFLHPTNLRINPLMQPSLTIRSLADEYFVKFPAASQMITLLRGQSKKVSVGPEPDVIHLHWWYDYDIQWLVKRYPKAKFVITLHDDRAWTGACHSTAGCMKFLEGCNACPIVRPAFHGLVSRRFRDTRQDLERFERIHFVAPTQHMKEVASIAGLSDIAPISVVPNPADGVFWNRPKSLIRQKTTTDHVFIRLGFISQNLNDPNKNLDRAIKLAEILTKGGYPTNLELVGYGTPKTKSNLVTTLGPRSPRQIADIASKWNALVSCSDSENSPLTLVEMAALGIPTITHPSPGVEELLKKTGQRATVSDWDAFLESPSSDELRRIVDLCSSTSDHEIASQAKLSFGPERITRQLLEVYGAV